MHVIVVVEEVLPLFENSLLARFINIAKISVLLLGDTYLTSWMTEFFKDVI